MNNQVGKLTFPEATQSVRRELYEIDVNLGKALAREERVAPCPFAQLYVDSLFAAELWGATPGLREPSLLVAIDQLGEETSLGRDLPLSFAHGRGELS